MKHSTGDWDFSSTKWELDETVYVSAPSSLSSLDYGSWLDALIKTSTVPISSVKEGRVTTYFRYAADGRVRVIFRYQDANNYYYAYFNPDDNIILVYRVKAGVPTLIDSVAYAFSAGIWYRLRVTWWNDAVGLVVRIEIYESGSWVIKLDAYDSENNWRDIGGRVGLGLWIWVGSKGYVDDTAIYGIS